MIKNYLLGLWTILFISCSLNAQNLSDNPAYYQQTAPSNQITKGLPISSTNIFEQIDTAISTVLCDSGTVTLVGTGIIYSAWSTDSLGVNVITTSDTFTSGTLMYDTSFYHTSISDSVSTSPTLAAQTGTYSSDVRGYYFIAPVDMIITGFWVPTDASSGVQHVDILRFGTAPPQYPALTNNFASLGSWRNYNALDTIPANIQIFAGDTLGIYGNRANINSYGPNNDIVIAGITTPIYRSGMQFPISTNTMQDVWSETSSSSISRVEFFYTTNPDTIVTLHNVTVGQSYTMSQTLTACNGDSVTFNNTAFVSDTVLVDSLTTGTGCDSIITTTIIIEPALTGMLSTTICTGDSIIVNGTTYNANNSTGTEVFTAVNGCDSIVSISLNIIPTLTDSFTTTICDNDSLVVNGTTYNASNSSGTEIFTSVNGCDSTVAVNINFISPVLVNALDTICNNDSIIINGTVYNAANPTGTETLTAANGCDSIITVNLNIQTIDISTFVSGFTINANQIGATYQWVDCNNGNAPISGATNRTYTVSGNGDYAVIIGLNGCSETSNCVNITGVSTEKVTSKTMFSIYPNPTAGLFTVELEAINSPTTISIFDVLGQRILQQEIQNTTTQINLNEYSNGTYFIEINNQAAISVNKLILRK